MIGMALRQDDMSERASAMRLQQRYVARDMGIVKKSVSSLASSKPSPM